MIVFFAFYWCFLAFYSFMGTEILAVDESLPHNNYSEEYTDLGKMIFIMFINASTDAYPDINFQAIRQSPWNYTYFYVFELINSFIFALIPGSLVYYTFR